MKKRNLLALFLGAAMLSLVLVGCSGENSGSTVETDQTPDTEEVSDVEPAEESILPSEEEETEPELEIETEPEDTEVSDYPEEVWVDESEPEPEVEDASGNVGMIDSSIIGGPDEEELQEIYAEESKKFYGANHTYEVLGQEFYIETDLSQYVDEEEHYFDMKQFRMDLRFLPIFGEFPSADGRFTDISLYFTDHQPAIFGVSLIRPGGRVMLEVEYADYVSPKYKTNEEGPIKATFDQIIMMAYEVERFIIREERDENFFDGKFSDYTRINDNGDFVSVYITLPTS